MLIFSLPLSETQYDELNLPIAVIKAVQEDAPTGAILKACISSDLCEKASLEWLFSFADSRLKAVGVATRADSIYLVLGSRLRNEDGRVFFPIERRGPDELNTKQTSRRDAKDQAILGCLNGILDSIEIGRQPFLCVGSKASSFADFTRSPASRYKASWGNSIAVYMSLGGDTLLLGDNDTVAWHQLETNNIIPCGKFVEWLKRYFEYVLAEEELSSWTDSGPTEQNKAINPVEKRAPGGSEGETER